MSFWSRVRQFLLKTSRPLTSLIGKIHLPYTRKRITSRDYRALTAILKPGMGLVTRTNGEFSNLFIPGHASHAGNYCHDRMVVEATGKGVVHTDLLDFAMTKDEIWVIRPRAATEEEMCAAADWTEKQIGDPYDLTFDPHNEAFYCSELFYQSYTKTMGAEKLGWEIPETWGMPTVVPQDLLDSPGVFECVLKLPL